MYGKRDDNEGIVIPTRKSKWSVGRKIPEEWKPYPEFKMPRIQKIKDFSKIDKLRDVDIGP